MIPSSAPAPMRPRKAGSIRIVPRLPEDSARRRHLLLACAVALAAPPGAHAQWWSYLRAPRTMSEVTELLETRFPDVPEITPGTLAAELAGSPARGPAALLLDVRTKAEYDVSHLAGATHAPDAKAALRLAASLSPGARIITYCSIGYRSAQAARELAEANHANVVNVDGGIFRWANEGRPIVRVRDAVVSSGNASASKATNSVTIPATTVHPYDAQWGQLLNERLRAPLAPADQPRQSG